MIIASKIESSCAATVAAAFAEPDPHRWRPRRAQSRRELPLLPRRVRPSLRVRTACGSMRTCVLTTASAAWPIRTCRASSCFSGNGRRTDKLERGVEKDTHRVSPLSPYNSSRVQPRPSLPPPRLSGKRHESQRRSAASRSRHPHPHIQEVAVQVLVDRLTALDRPDPSAFEHRIVNGDGQVRHLVSVAPIRATYMSTFPANRVNPSDLLEEGFRNRDRQGSIVETLLHRR